MITWVTQFIGLVVLVASAFLIGLVMGESLHE